MKFSIAIYILLFARVAPALSQDTLFARKIINDLTSSKMAGRGYVRDGGEKAAKYLSQFYKKYQLKPLNTNGSYSQVFNFPVNTFPNKMSLSINGRKLIPGVHFLVSPESKSLRGEFVLKKQDSITYMCKNDKNQMIVIQKVKKLTWTVASKPMDYCAIELLSDSFPNEIVNVNIDVENKMLSNYLAQNICGFIEGSSKSDSVLFLTAHYDHLGMMGKSTIFPGANDNSSGVSMLLSLIRHYSLPQNKPNHSIVFIAFAGEEAGLKGSEFFVKSPLVDLKKIKFLINLDLLGTGDEGITVVNATEHKLEFEKLNAINNENKYLTTIKSRGKAKNSDHYYFSVLGVKSFFIYTMGGIKAYHDVYDISKTLPLTKFTSCFYLIRDFINVLDK